MVRTPDGFATVTFERGKVDSVSGQQLTITEGTPKASYKTVTVTVPTNAVVRDNRQKASLSDVKAGQRVLVAHRAQAHLRDRPDPQGGLIPPPTQVNQ